MRRKYLDLTSERQSVSGTRPHRPAVIRVRRWQRGDRVRYRMDGWPLPVPAVLRHLDGRSVQGVVLALGVMAAFACAGAWAGWRLLFGARR